MLEERGTAVPGWCDWNLKWQECDGGPTKGRSPNAASYGQWASVAGTSLAGLCASLWLSKLGLLIFSRQVNFNYPKVYLAHGKILASLTHQTLKVQAISTVPFLHSTDTVSSSSLRESGTSLSISQTWHTHVKLRSSPEAPQFLWRNGDMPQHILLSSHMGSPSRTLYFIYMA